MLAGPAVAVIAVAAVTTGYLLARRGQQRTVIWSESATPASSPDVESLIRSGRKIDAIKRYRALHGVDLKEAKDAVDALERQLQANG